MNTNIVKMNSQKFNRFVDRFLLGRKNEISIAVITWNSGHYFVELCEEDGGVIPEHLDFFLNQPLGKKLNSISDLRDFIQRMDKIPILHSKNGNYRLPYDFFLWSGGFHMLYCPFNKKAVLRKQSLFQRLLFLGIIPPWLNDSY